MGNKVIRTLCYFTKKPDKKKVKHLHQLADMLEQHYYTIQTRRICCAGLGFKELEERVADPTVITAVGSLTLEQATASLDEFFQSGNVSFNLDLTDADITKEHARILFEIIRNKPEKTFNFTYVFNNPPNCPYFPSAVYKKEGFAVGLQPTDLSEVCSTMDEWLNRMREVWDELVKLLKKERGFLGIDSSVAPLFDGKSSLVHFVKNLGMSFDKSVLTDTYLKISRFVKTRNPYPIGLCGLMFPCLEDFELAEEYEHHNFSMERCIFLALHSGLGIDTYPIATDESPLRVVEILKVLQGLSDYYKKPLSARFVSDGKAAKGEKTDFKNQYLKDVTVLPL
jgi:uncharacterized protein (UPF0210 family)